MSSDDEGPGSIELSDRHVVAGVQYCQGVVAGEIVACALTRKACQRQLDDLERYAADPAYPYEFDEYRAGRVCRFLELLPHIKGPKANARQRIRLEPWQAFIFTTVYGWIHKATKKRRFRRAYAEIARGNAKSTILAGVSLYAVSADGEEGAEVASAATTREQARLVFGVSQAMLRKSVDLALRLGLRDTSHAIVHERTHSRFIPLSREADNQDGMNLHLGVVDELHAHKDRSVYDVLETALGKRDQSLLFVITTAGTDTAGICYEIRTYVKQILEGEVSDEEQFGIIYTIDDDDDWTDPVVWPKANPNWGISVMPNVIEGLARKAMHISSAQNNFKTKHLNVWCSADVSWMNMVAWDKCADRDLALEQFEGQEVWIALDLASRWDLACRVLLFKNEIEGATHYYLFVFSYLPEETLEQSTNASYEGWAREGWITTTPGAVLEFDFIQEAILADRARFRIREIPFDPYQAPQLASNLVAEGIEMVEYRNTVLTMSPPMKELEAVVLDGRLHHDGNPLMRWMIGNVVCHRDAKDNIFPRKTRFELKIDGPVATIMALGRAMIEQSDPYQERGIRTI